MENARDFYVHRLGLAILDDMPELKLLAVRAGQVRISIFGGYKPVAAGSEQRSGVHLIFKTDNLEQAIDELRRRGVVFSGPVVEAGDFIRDIATVDPDGNIIEFAEYLRDPLALLS